MTNAALSALRAAAQAKGSPLTAAEVKAAYAGSQREALRLRFLNVIRGAGYVLPGVAESICDKHIDNYMLDIPNFIKMMDDYERNDYDPD
jgi:hypothetical protein